MCLNTRSHTFHRSPGNQQQPWFPVAVCLPDGSDHPSSHLAVVNREKRNGWDPLCWHAVMPQSICSSVLESPGKWKWRQFPKAVSSCSVHSFPSLSAVHVPHWLKYSIQNPISLFGSSNTFLLCVCLIDSTVTVGVTVTFWYSFSLRKKTSSWDKWTSVQAKLAAIGIIITAEDC